MSSEALQLLAHMAWADAAVWSEIRDLPAAENDARITELLYHLHAVQWAYLQLLRGREVEIADVSDCESLSSLMMWGRNCHEQLLSFGQDLGVDDLERELRIPWANQLVAQFGDVQEADVRQGLIQITSHSTYHRGQINTRIRELGGEPPLVDFIAWVWMGQPEADRL